MVESASEDDSGLNIPLIAGSAGAVILALIIMVAAYKCRSNEDRPDKDNIRAPSMASVGSMGSVVAVGSVASTGSMGMTDFDYGPGYY